MLSVCSICVGLFATIIGLINTKSKQDKTEAERITRIEEKQDTILEKLKKIEMDMDSVTHNENQNSTTVVRHIDQIDDLKRRMDKAESAIIELQHK